MLVIDVVLRHHSWVRLLVPSGTMTARPQGGEFRSIPVQGSLGPVSEVYGVFSNRDLFSTSRRRQQWITGSLGQP